MLRFETPEQRLHSDVRRNIEACMETGNVDQARTVLVEYSETAPASAEALRTYIVKAYGTSL